MTPDIDDVEATGEEFEDTPQEDTPDRTIGSLMESDPLRMTGAQEPTDQTPKHHEVIDSVGPDTITGFQHIDALCEYLLKLVDDEGLSLTDNQASEVIRLWLNLDDFDKNKIIYGKRHRELLVQGRFLYSKKK
ncbi:hypothetical protein LSH36_688g00005 [Paralvinella palmiformis]|uniref:Uncharacterized protein n=1 Tax=Paralvinella palmiformis TaxID=53620 RepID=A0AAD9J481_9ANNE|nr:hypothetical protein LSH36_688g00005 [Paralvinella palmiformis]